MNKVLYLSTKVAVLIEAVHFFPISKPVLRNTSFPGVVAVLQMAVGWSWRVPIKIVHSVWRKLAQPRTNIIVNLLTRGNSIHHTFRRNPLDLHFANWSYFVPETFTNWIKPSLIVARKEIPWYIIFCTAINQASIIATYTLQIFPIKTWSRAGSGSGQEPGQAEDTFLPPREIIVEQGGRNLSFFSNFFPPRGEMTRCRVQSGLICSGIVEQSH